jgi:hypothetical protein
VFERQLANGTTRVFRADEWDRSDITVKPDAMVAGSCYQFITGNALRSNPDASLCPVFLGFFRSGVPRRYFWIPEGSGQTFSVRIDGAVSPLAECAIDTGSCEFYLAPVGAPAVALPVGDPNVRLVYNNDVLLLVNIASVTIDISQLVMEQEMPDGSRRLFLTAEWDGQLGSTNGTAAMRAGGCYELVTSEGTWIRPEERDCPFFLGWFRSNLSERYFWRSSDPDAMFDVRVAGNLSPIATCAVGAGVCEFYVPQ